MTLRLHYRRAAVLGLVLAMAACETATTPATPAATTAVRAADWRAATPAEWKFFADSEPATSDGGMVATDARLATDVGVEILNAGGNAVDAAVATGFALAVVYPVAGNVGGGGFAVVRLADGTVASLDFREKAPAAAHRDMYLDDAGEVTEDSVLGHRASGVPGAVAGLWELHQRYGSMPFAEVVAPAIQLAREGFVADADFAGAADDTRYLQFSGSAQLFRPGGEPVAEGSTWSNPELAAVLERVVLAGPAGFYEGPTADLIVAEMERGGGLITHDDLQAYEAIWRDPVVFDYRGSEVISMPPPSSGGLTLALIGNVLEGYDFGDLPWHGERHLHLLAETMRRAFADRNHWLGDPDFIDIPTEMFLSEDYAARLRAGIDLDAATPSTEINPGSGSDGSEAMHTTHYSVVDAEGNAVGLTTTINHGNGSGVVVEGAGFLLNNEMDDFASKPGSPNAFGLVQGEANAIAPNKRMLSAMTPTIVVRDGQAQIVSGASGGPTIITGTFQVISNVMDFGLPINDAVRAPRIHQQHLPDRLLFEGEGLSEAQVAALTALGHHPTPGRFNIAIAASLRRVGASWTGAHDPRALGAARGQ
jgi:gamma-glutamyltranspeptidase/glutathione hydrolase